MKVIKNGVLVEKTYEEICEELGFIAKVQFVEVTNRGTITFTLGRPEEIRALASAIEREGYKASSKLIKRLHNM